MKPFFLLLGTFVLSLGITFFINGTANVLFSGRLALSVMLLFTAIGHFAFTKGMAMMVPDIVPFKTQMVYFTGILEIIAAISLHFESLRMLTGWALMVFFIVLLPANINAAVQHIDYEKGTYEGKGLSYLWFRVPFQVLLIGWTFFFVIGI